MDISRRAKGSQGARHAAAGACMAEATADADSREDKAEPEVVAAKVDDPVDEVKEEHHNVAVFAIDSGTDPVTRGAQETGSEATTAATTTARGRHPGRADRPETERWENGLQRCLWHS